MGPIAGNGDPPPAAPPPPPLPPVVTPQAVIPEAPPPPPVVPMPSLKVEAPTSIYVPDPTMLASGSVSAPASPPRARRDLGAAGPANAGPFGGSMTRNRSFTSLLQSKFFSEFPDFHMSHHFHDNDHDDDNMSIASMDSCASSVSAQASRHGSVIDMRKAGEQSAASNSADVGSSTSKLTSAAVSKLPDSLESPTTTGPGKVPGKKAHIWEWLTTTSTVRQPLPEGTELATSERPRQAQVPDASKVDISALKKLAKKYPKYYREMNAVSPNNW